MTREELLKAALRMYAEHGYQGATMRKIADEVGIKPASIYFFFKNKEALFIEAFRQILENHHAAMKRVLTAHQTEPVDRIFSAMLRGIVEHHTADPIELSSYISLVTAPIPEIKAHLHQYIQNYNSWMTSSLEDALRKDYPSIQRSDIDRLTKQFVLLGNGVFWGINLYAGDYLTEQLTLADQLLQAQFTQLSRIYA